MELYELMLARQAQAIVFLEMLSSSEVSSNTKIHC
jgi:hypothetical protein